MDIGKAGVVGCLVCAVLPAQVHVTAAGTLTVAMKPLYGPVVTHTQLVTGPGTLSVPGVGSVVLTIGTVSTMTMTAMAPPDGCYGCWSAPRGDVVLEYSSPVPIAGVLRLETAPACYETSPYFDVDVDGHRDVWPVGPVSVDVPVVLGAAPVPIRMWGEAVNYEFGPSACGFPMQVGFVALPSSLSTVNAACGPTLAGTYTGDVGGKKLIVRVAPRNGLIGALLVGGAPVPQPGVCALAMPLDAFVLLPTGVPEVAMTVPVAAALVGTFTLQSVELLRNGALAYSNGVVAVLP